MNVVAKQGDSIYLMSSKEFGTYDVATEDPEALLVSIRRGTAARLTLNTALKQGYFENVDESDIAPEVMEKIKRYSKTVVDDLIAGVYLIDVLKGEDDPNYRQKYNVDNAAGSDVGTLYFGGEIPFEITSQDKPLLTEVGPMMVNPITYIDNDGGSIVASIGDFLYEEAFVGILRKKGYAVTPLAE